MKKPRLTDRSIIYPTRVICKSNVWSLAVISSERTLSLAFGLSI